MVKKTKKDIHAQQDVREAGVAETGVETPGTAPEDLQAPTVDRELEEKARECAENYDKYLRAVAELDNYRKRAAKEKADAIKYGNESLIRELLPLADSLERALQHADKSNDFESFKKGLGMLKDQLLCCLGKHGVEPIDLPTSSSTRTTTRPSCRSRAGNAITIRSWTNLKKDIC